MQGPTHILTGVILKRIFNWKYYTLVAAVLIALLGLLSHAILDKVAKATYHPPHTDFTDAFWLSFHIIVWLCNLVLLYVFWAEYKLGIIFALLPDIDWLLVDTAGAFGKELIFYQKPWMHEALNWFMDHVPPFTYLNELPDNTLLPLACIWELLLGVALWLFYKALMNRRRNVHF